MLKRAKAEKACVSEYKRAYDAETIDELCQVIKDNLDWNNNHNILTVDLAKEYDNPKVFNIGKNNVGLFNSGDRNSGDLNSGDRNSGDLNSGVFCTKKRSDFVPFFNKESNMTWDEWYNHPAYKASFSLGITDWVSWDNMTDEEKIEHPKAYVCEGYLKTYSYHDAWKNLWENLSEEQKESFKKLPNFDSEIFKEVTGINIDNL